MRRLLMNLVLLTMVSCGHKPVSTTVQGEPGGQNPFLGEGLYVDGQSQAAIAANSASGENAPLIRMIAEQPQADWLGEWSGPIATTVNRYLSEAESEGKLRVMIAYNVPNRDCDQYSKGGLGDETDYLEWIDEMAEAIGHRKTVVILEPDTLGQLKMCLSEKDQEARLDMLRKAIARLKRAPKTSVYLDAGNALWIEAEEMAKRLTAAGVSSADGFAINVSNYVATDKSIAYGEAISRALGGSVPFVVDTSRNGKGAISEDDWCNPPGRGLGTAPTTETGHPLVHAFLWLKRPGESDGTCNDGPPAGAWYEAQALELARNAAL